ncbi:hypothetical protein F511_05615 [Dorcoceras hygrometricum]|uniref:Uncharacterized protein n=1 Tax=Dorcoceras hygrometricum TaxID=472368 RepID=A0A2Z7CLE7_9LAMI|nr:hypothetical protein F511_05615 [Dorcoceras hygrometricum]
MASALFVNALRVNFDTMLTMEHSGMVKMFKSVEDSRLKIFLERSGSVYEEAILEFFTNVKILAGTIVNLAPNKKRDMPIEFRLLHDIVAKDICAKAGSFDQVTSEKLDLMVAITAGLKVNWAQILFQVLFNMVHTTKRQSQGFAIQVSALLQYIFKDNLGESVKLRSQKVLTSKSVQTYIKQNSQIKPTGETSMYNEDTASNTEGGGSQDTQPVQAVATTSLAAAKETCVNNPKKIKHKDGEKKKRTKNVTELTTQTAEKQTVEERRPVAPTHIDSEEISEPDSCPLVTRRCRREQVSESSDSESTISLPLKDFVKKKRNQRQRTQMGWTAANIGSQPDATPVSPTEQERTANDQMVQGSGGDHFAKGLEFDAREEHEGQKDQEITADDRECYHSDSIPNVPVGYEGNLDDEHLNIGSNEPEKQPVRLRDISSIESFVKIEEQLLEWGETEDISDLFERHSLIMYKLFELELEKLYHEHLANFKLDVPSVNHDFECIIRLHKELREIAAVHMDHRVLASLPTINHDTSYLASDSHQEHPLALEFPHLVDHEQGAAQATSLQLNQPGHETPVMTSHEHQAQENEPAIQTDEHRTEGNEHQALDELVQGPTQALEDRPAIFVPSAQHDSDHQGHDPSNLQLIASASAETSTLQLLDTATQFLTALSTRISSLDQAYACIRNDTNMTRHHTILMRDQLKNSVDGLDIKIDVLERTLTQRMVDELAVVKSQLDALIEGVQEFGAAKIGEYVQNRPGVGSSGDGPSNVLGKRAKPQRRSWIQFGRRKRSKSKK